MFFCIFLSLPLLTPSLCVVGSRIDYSEWSDVTGEIDRQTNKFTAEACRLHLSLCGIVVWVMAEGGGVALYTVSYLLVLPPRAGHIRDFRFCIRFTRRSETRLVNLVGMRLGVV